MTEKTDPRGNRKAGQEMGSKADPQEGWLAQQARRREIVDQARALPREPSGWLPRAALVGSTSLWVAVVAWLFATLPERVPIHWAGDVPDGWASRGVALSLSLLGPLLFAYPMVLVSRWVLAAPEIINVRDRAWWQETPSRLVRLERLLREDLMLIAALTQLLQVTISIQIGVAAHRSGGVVAGWWIPTLVGGFLLLLCLIMVRMLAGPRYRADPSDV